MRGLLFGDSMREAGDGEKGVLRYLSQLLLSSEFIVDGANVFLTPGERVQEAATLNVPNPVLAVKANGLALNVAPRAAATLLACCLIPTTLAGHPSGRNARKRDAPANGRSFSRTSLCWAGCYLWRPDSDRCRCQNCPRLVRNELFGIAAPWP